MLMGVALCYRKEKLQHQLKLSLDSSAGIEQQAKSAPLILCQKDKSIYRDRGLNPGPTVF